MVEEAAKKKNDDMEKVDRPEIDDLELQPSDTLKSLQ